MIRRFRSRQAFQAALSLIVPLTAGCATVQRRLTVEQTAGLEAVERFVADGRRATFTSRASLRQNGSAVTGSYSNSGGNAGTLTGTVSGSHFEGTLTSTVQRQTCTLSGDISANGTMVAGTSSCSNGVAGSFTLNRI